MGRTEVSVQALDSGLLQGAIEDSPQPQPHDEPECQELLNSNLATKESLLGPIGPDHVVTWRASTRARLWILQERDMCFQRRYIRSLLSCGR